MANITNLKVGDTELKFSVEETVYFNESPTIRSQINSEPTNNLSDAYPYHQGVEIRSFKNYAAGFVKILTGDPGNTLKQCVFGQEDDGLSIIREGSGTFNDNLGFNPVDYIQGKLTSFEFVDSKNQAYISYGQLNGVIEPLTIRDVISLNSIYFPYEAHSVWGSYGNGNESHVRSSESIVSVCEININSNIPFLDYVDVNEVTNTPGSGYFIWDQPIDKPFVDETINSKFKNQLNGLITNFIDNLNYGDEGYVPTGQIAQTSGFIYDGATLGTDSIAFGGMKYT